MFLKSLEVEENLQQFNFATVKKYVFVSIFGYLSVYVISSLLAKTTLISSHIYTYTYLVVYFADYICTSMYVFQKKIGLKSVYRFVYTTLIFLGLGNGVFLFNLALFDRISVAVIFTGFILSPFKFLISKNYVYSEINSMLVGLKQSIGEVCRSLSSLLNTIDRKQMMRTRSKVKFFTWLKSLLGFQNIEVLIDLDLPWWPFSVESYLENYLRSNPNAKVFEWGSGASTFWLSKRSANVISIEHDEEWSRVINNLLNDKKIKNVDMKCIPALYSASPIVTSKKPGTKNLDFSNYVNKISEFGEFDLIVVDGRVRKFCLKRGLDHLAPNGILLLDNSNRKRYSLRDINGIKIEFRGLTPASPWKTKSTIFSKPSTL